jgi:hypothetical protein
MQVCVELIVVVAFLDLNSTRQFHRTHWFLSVPDLVFSLMPSYSLCYIQEREQAEGDCVLAPAYARHGECQSCTVDAAPLQSSVRLCS